MTDVPEEQKPASILVVDADIVSRLAVAEYLRGCDYSVIEAATTAEAFVALKEATLSIDVILCDVSALGSQSGFELSSWVRKNRPELEVRLAGGNDDAARTAADLCEQGPQQQKPYDHSILIDYIKRLRASRNGSFNLGDLSGRA